MFCFKLSLLNKIHLSVCLLSKLVLPSVQHPTPPKSLKNKFHKQTPKLAEEVTLNTAHIWRASEWHDFLNIRYNFLFSKIIIIIIIIIIIYMPGNEPFFSGEFCNSMTWEIWLGAT
jgi:hypothetical protein